MINIIVTMNLSVFLFIAEVALVDTKVPAIELPDEKIVITFADVIYFFLNKGVREMK